MPPRRDRIVRRVATAAANGATAPTRNLNDARATVGEMSKRPCGEHEASLAKAQMEAAIADFTLPSTTRN